MTLGHSTGGISNEWNLVNSTCFSS
jgi:hypothetical protein